MSTPIESGSAVLRIIDANLNRAREALRVMEEYVRFALDDVVLSEAIKTVRHDLVSSIPPTIAQSLPISRDIVGDVGCTIETESEYQRADVLSVARAAGKRLSEALRVIEEYGKTIDSAWSAGVERIRYRGYELERRLEAVAAARQRFGHVKLYVILTESLCHGGWLAAAESALRGGADALQLREKGLADRELLSRAKRLAGLCREHNALFIVNDRPDIAGLAHAHGVHLGQDDMSLSEARRILPAHVIIGISTHNEEQIRRATQAGPDYIAVGPMFQTDTKPQNHIAGLETLAAARQYASLPLVAIGGIDATNAEVVLEHARRSGQGVTAIPSASTSANPRGLKPAARRERDAVLEAVPCALCVCRSVIAQPDAEQAAARLRAMFKSS